MTSSRHGIAVKSATKFRMSDYNVLTFQLII